MDFLIVTCADKPPKQSYYLWDAFHRSLERYGIKPIVLGFGQKWRGLGSKPKLLQQAIENGVITSKVIIFCDAFDVVFAKNPAVIVEHLFASAAEVSGTEVVWNAEKSCFPNAALADNHPSCATPFRYLNSGLSVGFTDSFLKALKEMNANAIPDDFQNADGSWTHSNDQNNWMVQFLNGVVGMRLDSRCEVFQTMYNVTADEMDMSGTLIRNTITNTTPAAFHFNGGAKTQGLREPVLKHLGL